MKRVLIIPQLDQHHLSTKLFHEELSNRGFEVDILNLGGYYNATAIGNIKLKRTDFIGYKYGNTRLLFRQIIDRIVYLSNLFFIKKLVCDYSHIIAFSEPILIRGIIYFANLKGCKTHLVMEGMRSEHRVNISSVILTDIPSVFHQIILRIKYQLLRLHQGTFISTLLPGINGSTKVSTISPIGPYSAKVVSSLIHPFTRILKSGVPKYVGIESLKDIGSTPQDVIKVVYFTSAFKWHDKIRYASCQTRDIKSIVELVKSLPSCRLTIKTHPRDILDEEIRLLIDEQQIFHSEDKSVLELLSCNDFCLGNISTVLAEGELWGAKMLSVLINFPIQELKNSFVWNLKEEPVLKVNDLRSILVGNKDLGQFDNESGLIYSSVSVKYIIEDMFNEFR